MWESKKRHATTCDAALDVVGIAPFHGGKGKGNKKKSTRGEMGAPWLDPAEVASPAKPPTTDATGEEGEQHAMGDGVPAEGPASGICE